VGQSPRSRPRVWWWRQTSRGAGYGLMVTDFCGGSNLHRLLDLHLLGVVRLMNDTVRAAAARELLGDLVCGVPG
jgi:hypothetical protein